MKVVEHEVFLALYNVHGETCISQKGACSLVTAPRSSSFTWSYNPILPPIVWFITSQARPWSTAKEGKGKLHRKLPIICFDCAENIFVLDERGKGSSGRSRVVLIRLPSKKGRRRTLQWIDKAYIHSIFIQSRGIGC